MKLNETRPNIETSGELEEQFFSIQDTGMIFDILRNKMYSNPMLAICREISCNARDAHREVGTPEVPVHIHLPNHLEPFYKIKDFGPGISPDRMSNIFIKYTASTKRVDNVQTGGFGLGAKTPFSYSDTFTILTNFEGMQYNYACFIDETKVGKLALMSEAPTSEPNGTEIIIPVKNTDFRFFADYTEQATRHWEVRPIIKGGNITYQTIKKILEGDQWAVCDTNNDYNRYAKMVIDGIEYPLEMNTLRMYADPKLIDAAKGNFLMYFGVGELSLSASREQIYLDEPTQQKIRGRLDDIMNDIKKRVTDKIDSFTNLWEANIYYRHQLTQAFHNLTFLGQLKWKGIELHNQSVQTGCSVYAFRKGKYSRKNGHDPNKLSRSLTQHIFFDAASCLFVNDLPIREPTPRHVKKAFEDDPKLETIQVLVFNDKVNEASLDKDISLDKMLPKRMSSITKASARAYVAATSRLLLFKFDPRACAFRQVSYASIEEDTNPTKVLVKLNKDPHSNSRDVLLKSKRYVSPNILSDLLTKYTDTSLYGVDASTPQDRIEEDLDGFEDLEEMIDDKVLKNKNIDFIAIKYALNCHLDERWLKEKSRVQSGLTDPNSVFLKRLTLQEKIKSMKSADGGLLRIYETFKEPIEEKDLEDFVKKNPDFDMEVMETAYYKKYPLLSWLNGYNHRVYSDDSVPPVLDYVNLVDKG